MRFGALVRAQREAAARKPVLRHFYDAYARWIAERVAGCEPVLELGAGAGVLAERIPRAIRADPAVHPWRDLALDAHALPFATGSLGAIVMVDVLHHLWDPRRFLGEVSRVLAPGGCLAMVEPYVSGWGRVVWGLLHHEPVRMGFDWRAPRRPAAPFDFANGAIPTLLFGDAGRAEAVLDGTGLRLEARDYFDLLAYPLCGGYGGRQWAPARWLEAQAARDARILSRPALARRLALKLGLLLRKRATAQ